ncbi:MAG: homoserine dehydrogenase [Armatimonadetes bacterium]|nr:homoserine dehydrogenase [Armatimonadota bacterium]
MAAKEIGIGLIGMGTVGTGVVKILRERGDTIAARTGLRPVLRQVAVRNLGQMREVALPPEMMTADPQAVIARPDVDIVVELMGGYEPARTLVLKAIESGKHVVTANKAIIALYGQEIFAAAREKGVLVYFEASVGGAIPILAALRESFVANEIRAIFGIVNGTTNYILTRMTEDGMDFGEALAEAVRGGYAEADPTLDLEGIDAAHKLAILASCAFGIPVDMEDVYVEGISEVCPQDISYAREFGYVIKLLAIAKEAGGSIELRVHPTMLSRHHPLASVRETYNAIYVEGDAIGKAMFLGRGAGRMPTASAVVSDIVEAILRSREADFQAERSLYWNRKTIQPMSEVACKFYLRFPIVDQPGVIGKIATVLGSHGISITSVRASLVEMTTNAGHVEMLTHRAGEAAVQQALQEINALPVMRDKSMYLRIEE